MPWLVCLSCCSVLLLENFQGCMEPLQYKHRSISAFTLTSQCVSNIDNFDHIMIPQTDFYCLLAIWQTLIKVTSYFSPTNVVYNSTVGLRVKVGQSSLMSSTSQRLVIMIKLLETRNSTISYKMKSKCSRRR